MEIGRRLGEGKVAEVFELGADVLKLYRAGVGPEAARREADNLRIIAGLQLPAPQAFDVVELDGRWGVRMTRAAGMPLAAQMAEAGGFDAAIGLAVGLHRQVHRQPGLGLMPLKARLAGQIGRAALLAPEERRAVLDRLDALPDGDRVCHGDFHPFNVMVDGATLTIIDWPDATCGPPAADVARTYLLALHNLPDLAERYLDRYLDDAALERATVLDWLPVLAGGRLSENVPEEDARLLALVRSG